MGRGERFEKYSWMCMSTQIPNMVMKSAWVPDSQVVTCSEVIMLRTDPIFLNSCFSDTGLSSLCCDEKTFTVCLCSPLHFPLPGMQVEIQLIKISLMGRKTSFMPENENKM